MVGRRFRDHLSDELIGSAVAVRIDVIVQSQKAGHADRNRAGLGTAMISVFIRSAISCESIMNREYTSALWLASGRLREACDRVRSEKETKRLLFEGWFGPPLSPACGARSSGGPNTMVFMYKKGKPVNRLKSLNRN